MALAALALCVALGAPADTPDYTYRERISALNQCVDVADAHYEKTGDADPLGQVLGALASCLSYCER